MINFATACHLTSQSGIKKNYFNFELSKSYYRLEIEVNLWLETLLYTSEKSNVES